MVICILMRPACALALTHLSFFTQKKIYSVVFNYIELLKIFAWKVVAMNNQYLMIRSVLQSSISSFHKFIFYCVHSGDMYIYQKERIVLSSN